MDETPARVVDEGRRSRYQERVVRRNSSGARVLEEVRFRGKRTALVFKSA